MTWIIRSCWTKLWGFWVFFSLSTKDCFFRWMCVLFALKFFFPFFKEISASLIPPSLDPSLTVKDRLWHLQSCFQKESDKERSVIIYDFIQSYKILLLSCGISLEQSYEDPKVSCLISILFIYFKKYFNVLGYFLNDLVYI